MNNKKLDNILVVLFMSIKIYTITKLIWLCNYLKQNVTSLSFFAAYYISILPLPTRKFLYKYLLVIDD